MLGFDTSCIPVVDPRDTSLWAGLSEFFGGYFYCGPRRYEILPSSNANLGTRVEERETSHAVSSVCKLLLCPTGIVPAIGMGCWCYNCCTISSRKIRVFNIREQYETIQGAPATMHFESPTLNFTKLSFTEFRRQKYPNRTLFGDYSKERWFALVAEYRQCCIDIQEFLFQMLLLKRDLLNWRAGVAERTPQISLQHFVEQAVPELLQTEIHQLIPDCLLQRLRQERDMLEALENLIQNRLTHTLESSEGSRIRSDVQFLKTLDPARRFDINEVFLSKANQQQLAFVASVLQQESQNVLYFSFLEALLRTNFQPEHRNDRLQAVFAHFWPVSQTEVALSPLPKHKASIWVYLLAFVSFDDLKAILATCPPEHARKVKQQVVDYLALRQSLDPYRVKEQLSALL